MKPALCRGCYNWAATLSHRRACLVHPLSISINVTLSLFLQCSQGHNSAGDLPFCGGYTSFLTSLTHNHAHRHTHTHTHTRSETRTRSKTRTRSERSLKPHASLHRGTRLNLAKKLKQTVSHNPHKTHAFYHKARVHSKDTSLSVNSDNQSGTTRSQLLRLNSKRTGFSLIAAILERSQTGTCPSPPSHFSPWTKSAADIVSFHLLGDGGLLEFKLKANLRETPADPQPRRLLGSRTLQRIKPANQHQASSQPSCLDSRPI